MVRNKLGNKLAKELALKLYVLSSFQFNDIYPLGYLCVYISTHTQKETNGQTETRGKETASNGTPTKPFLSPSMLHLSDMGWVHQKMECSRTSVLLSVFSGKCSCDSIASSLECPRYSSTDWWSSKGLCLLCV